MKRRVLIAVLILAILAGTSMANDYWPTSGYSTYHYRDDGGSDMVVTMDNGNRTTFTADYYMKQIFEAAALGNVRLSLSEVTGLAPGNLRIPYTLNYSPPMQFLTASLAVGQTGNGSTTATDAYGTPATVWCSWTVMAEEVVEVPAGTFNTIVLEVIASEGIESGIYHLSSGIGPVVLPRGYRLVGVDGTVPASQTTWGSLKSLFR